MNDQRADRLEEMIAHLQRATDELSDVVSAQANEIERLSRRLALLMEREAEREADGSIALTDRRPPHW